MGAASLMMNYDQLEPVQFEPGMRDVTLAAEGLGANAGALFLDYGRRKALEYADANFVVDGVPVFQALTIERPKNLSTFEASSRLVNGPHD